MAYPKSTLGSLQSELSEDLVPCWRCCKFDFQSIISCQIFKEGSPLANAVFARGLNMQ